jgi:hypothetical protein
MTEQSLNLPYLVYWLLHPCLLPFLPAELTKQSLDLKEVFDVARVPHPELPNDHPDNRTVDGHNLWPPGQVRLAKGW